MTKSDGTKSRSNEKREKARQCQSSITVKKAEKEKKIQTKGTKLVRNFRSNPLVSQVKACDENSNSEIAKLTHAVNQQTSVVTTAMTAMLKQFQATPPPAPVKAVEEICVTCGGAHPYYQSSSRLNRDQTSFQQKVENSNLEEHLPPVVTMADNRTMAQLLRAPIEGYAEAIVVPSILAEQFELKHSLINMMTTDQFFGLEKDNPHVHIRCFNKITSTIKYMDVPNSVIKLILFPFSLAGAARRTTSLRNEILNFQQKFDESFHEAWDRYKDHLRACPHHGFTELHQLNTFYNALNPADQDSLNAAAGDNLLKRNTQDVLTIIENKSKVRNSRSKPIASQVKACDTNSNSKIAKLTHAVNQQTSVVTTTMTTMLKQFQATPPPALVKAVEETCVTCGGSGYLPSNTVSNPKGELKAITTRSGLVTDGPTVPIHPKSITPEVDECVEETYTDRDLAEYTIKVPPPPIKKYKPPSQREFGHPKKLPEKLRDPGKFLIPCGFSELKCKALADLGASIILWPLSVWRELGLPELIPTRMTLELANRAICTPAGIARDVFVPVGKFTFPVDFVIVNYKSDPRFPLILGRPFLRTARALIDVHGEEMILRDGDERLALNMKHDTSSYSNQPQRESVNLINIFNVSSEDFLEVLFSNQQIGNPTFSPHQELTSLEVTNNIFDSEGCNVLSEKLPDLNYTKDLHPPLDDNLLSGSTTYSSNSFLEEFTDELALITYPPEYDDNLQFDIESNLKEIEFLLYQDKDSIESDAENVYDDPFDSNGEKIKESKLLIDELDQPDDFLPPFEYDSFISQDFSRVDALSSTNNEDKVFNPGIIIQEKPVKIITRVVQDKKLAISNASLVLENFDPPFYEPLFFKEVPKAKMLLPFSSENKETVFKPGMHTSEKFILILSQNYLIQAIMFLKSIRFSKT
nr:reverse transcriptase domain-containing protein [Tanacetum cinerariifolium]